VGETPGLGFLATSVVNTTSVGIDQAPFLIQSCHVLTRIAIGVSPESFSKKSEFPNMFVVDTSFA
jgi:hypothetical protein